MTDGLDIANPWEELSDTYVTDGRRLWRVVSLPGSGRRLRRAVLEDCQTLELRTCRRARLWRLRKLRCEDTAGAKEARRALTIRAPSVTC
jgi:hypothetical protein